MTDGDDLVPLLTEAVLAVPAVRGLFPHSPTAAAVAGVLPWTHQSTAPLVAVDARDGVLVVSTRLSIDVATPSVAAVRAVRAAVATALGRRPHRLVVRIAHVD